MTPFMAMVVKITAMTLSMAALVMTPLMAVVAVISSLAGKVRILSI
jgi:hypothetical protein